MKRLFDFFISLGAIVLLTPFWVLIAIIQKASSFSAPILFKQVRIGKDGRPFLIYKYRTMVVNAEKKGPQVTIGRDPRITAVGAFLRKYKLDELPQLFNVFFGTMSFVGPRPEVEVYLNTLSSELKREILSVKPGITSLASIEFKNENEILDQYDDPIEAYIKEVLPKKIAIEKSYIENRSLRTDFKIIMTTLKEIV